VSSNLKIALCQMTSVDDVEANLQQIEKLCAPIEKADVIFFPENCLFMRLKEGDLIRGLDLEDPAFLRLGELAKNKSCYLHLGSVPLRENGKLSNASVVISPRGEARCSYRKIHLFDITLEGQNPVRESDAFIHGSEPLVLDMVSWRWGQTICYDLRFSELFSIYAHQSVDAILVPAAFLIKTGQAHWEILLRARAIESQCYVIATAQAGAHRNGGEAERKTYGHSLVVNPWGEIIAEGSADHPEILLAELDRDLIEKVRRQIPMSGHRRLK